jgi:hypothetical protein
MLQPATGSLLCKSYIANSNTELIIITDKKTWRHHYCTSY